VILQKVAGFSAVGSQNEIDAACRLLTESAAAMTATLVSQFPTPVFRNKEREALDQGRYRLCF